MSMIRIQFGVLDISNYLNGEAIDNTDTDTKWHILDPIDAVKAICCCPCYAAMKWTDTGNYRLLNDLETALWQEGVC